MNERVFKALEFNKIINLLISHVETSLGYQLVNDHTPKNTLEEVQILQDETDEAAQMIRLNKEIPFGGIFDIRSSLKRSVIGGILNTEECLDIATTIYGSRRVKASIEKLEEHLPILKGLCERIIALFDLEKEIKSCIDDSGHVLDHASPALRGIRSSIKAFESRIRDHLNQITRSKSNLLSDTIITIRNDRYVLPVKHEHRGAFGGVIHDQSSSGQTLFMEPNAIVQLNNQLQEARAKEKQEITKILQKLTEEIAVHEPELQENIQMLAKIDFIYARAKLGAEMDAVTPKLNDQGVIKMRQARHPLIPREDVVANDIEIGETYHAILITGPNTGGKTVVLKMIGLCTLMAQSGLQIPAMDGCELSVFRHVFADIGDEQSIEQSLSTFSSHMTNIVSILDHVDEKTLVLFDELGAGTDPQEGAALAMSILDEVISRRSTVIATTHYPELKAFGFNRDHVMNASVEFNIETLKPTYRLLIGVPGRSNAFEISKQLGLNGNIIDRAKSHIGIDQKNVENMIVSLEESRKKAERDYEEAHAILINSEKLREEIEKEWKQFYNQRERLYQQAEEKANEAIQEAKEEAELIVQEIKEMKSASFKEHEWIEAKKMLDDATVDLSSKDEKPIVRPAVKQQLQQGDEIKLLTINQTGTVLEKVSEDEYFIQVGVMRLKAKKEDLELVKQKHKPNTEPLPMIRGSNAHVSIELDLRGERYEEAQAKLERYIDRALLAGHAKVHIIHGKGTGALRKGVQSFAKNHPRITSYREGSAGEGGSGVTIMELQ